MKISIDIKYVICALLKCNAVPINIGTATAPEYIANKCCKPKIACFPKFVFCLSIILLPQNEPCCCQNLQCVPMILNDNRYR